MGLGLIRRYINLTDGKVSDKPIERELGVKAHLNRGSDLGSFLGFVAIASVFVIMTLGFIGLFIKVIELASKFMGRYISEGETI